MRLASADQSTFFPTVSRSAGDARSKLSFEVSDHLARHLTLVLDPKDIVSEVELDRKRKFHLLIRRYISQIQYGCKNPSCTTPTCFSCRTRLASSPVRKYTALSARTLACFLADARDPEGALCPHEALHPVEWLAPQSPNRSEYTLPKRNSGLSHLASRRLAQNHVNGKQPSRSQPSSDKTATHRSEEGHVSQIPLLASWTSLKPPPQPTKDPKSFTQALFDSLPLKLLEWPPHTSQRSNSQCYYFESRKSSYGATPQRLKGTPCPKSMACPYDDNPGAAGCNDVEAYKGASTAHLNGNAMANGHAKEPKSSKTLRVSAIGVALGNGGLESSAHPLPIVEGVDHELIAGQSSRRQSDSSERSSTSEDLRSNPQQSSSSTTEGDRSPSVPTLTLLSTKVLEELENLRSRALNDLANPELSDFLRQSLYYCLKDPCRGSASFQDSESGGIESGAIPSSGEGDRFLRLNSQSVRTNLRSMAALCSWREIIRNLFIATHSLYVPTSSRRPPLPSSLLNSHEAACVCVIGLYALSELVRIAIKPPYMVSAGLPDHIPADRRVRLLPKQCLDLLGVFGDCESLNLLEKIVNVIANRWTLWEISKARRNTDSGNCESKPPNMIQSILDYMEGDADQTLETCAQTNTSTERYGPYDVRPDTLDGGSLSILALYWLRALMLRDWNGRSVVRKSDTVANILHILAAMYERHHDLGLEPVDFWTKVLVKRFDPFDMPMEWLSFPSDGKNVHILSYSFLFPPETVVTYFRAINYSRMMKIMEGVTLTKRAYNEFVASAHFCQIPVPRREALEERIGIVGLPRFVIEVRRDNVLTGAINQIWRRQKGELLKPLKVRVGTDEGEEGVDSGGVQQEMFRVLFGEALDPSYGMFTVDEETRMTWFQPQSFEPLFKFEALGILMSLAVYNSITLPITFPIAFYRKLLGLKVKKVAHIADGWPLLAKNLQALLDWEDGDVAEVFTRTYEFSYEAFGKSVNIDMERNKRDMPWPPQVSRKGKEKVKAASFDVPLASSGEATSTPVSSSTSRAQDATADTSHQCGGLEASLVTNANREQYVKDYIFWLTDKSIQPQYEAFARGFYTCLDRTALSIFTAEALQSFIEGVQEIDVDGLQASTVYDGYTAEDQVVTWFWEVVKSWEHRERKLLLEFITASDRVPVNGVSVIGLVIQCAGRSDEILPRSMTCFATFLLPLYSSKEVLERMLGIAIEHAKGFGTV